MKTVDFRKLALSMPEATESAHMGHPDFRVRNKIFATLFTRDEVEWGMVKLTPAQQKQFIKDDPDVFEPIKGAWGRGGATQVCIKAAKKDTLRRALFTAWLNTAPKSLVDALDEESKT